MSYTRSSVRSAFVEIAQALSRNNGAPSSDAVMLSDLPALLASAMREASEASGAQHLHSHHHQQPAFAGSSGLVSEKTAEGGAEEQHREEERLLWRTASTASDGDAWEAPSRPPPFAVGDLVEVPSALIDARRAGVPAGRALAAASSAAAAAAASASASTRWYKAEVVRTTTQQLPRHVAGGVDATRCGAGAPLFAARSLLGGAHHTPTTAAAAAAAAAALAAAAAFPDEIVLQQLVGLRLVVQDAQLSGVPSEALRLVRRGGGSNSGEGGEMDVASQQSLDVDAMEEPGLGSGEWTAAPPLCGAMGSPLQRKKRPRNDENVHPSVGAIVAGEGGLFERASSPSGAKRSRDLSGAARVECLS